MNTNICGNCDFSRYDMTGNLRCCRFSHNVLLDESCPEYFNYRKTQIYNKLLQNLTKEGK